MDATTFHARVARERGHGTVPSNYGPGLIPCCFNECDRPGRREHLVGIREVEKVSIYFFCSGRHKVLWVHSSKDLGNLPTGSRGMIT